MNKTLNYILIIISGLILGAFVFFAGLGFYTMTKPKAKAVVTIAVTATPVPVIITPMPSANPNTPVQTESIGVTQGQKYNQKLVENGSKNILIVGEDKIAGLYDTIGIISIEKENKKMKIIMIPRDMYINYSDNVKQQLEADGRLKISAFYKINSAHNTGIHMKYQGKFSQYSMSFLAQLIKEIFDIEIHDYIKINTQGLKEVVDLFGGVDVTVPYDMNYDDPYQSLSIHLKKGNQHLNGKQAEGFVRFRQGYNSQNKFISIGDIERKKNQMTFINAFMDQHLTIGNITKLPDFMGSMKKNLKTSVGAGSLLTSYAGIMKDVATKKYTVENVAITGKNTTVRGSYFYLVGEVEGIN